MQANVVSSVRTVRMCSLGLVLRLVVVRVELGGWMTVMSWNRLSKNIARSVDLQLCHNIILFNYVHVYKYDCLQ